MWQFLLLFLSYVALPESCAGELLDISNSVNATASSVYKIPSSPEISFSPRLAIQADSRTAWANCFVSNNELNPWFALEFKSLTTIFNVRLDVRSEYGKLPEEFQLSGMNNMSVFVSNSTTLGKGSRQVCGSPWNFTVTNSIDVDCGRTLKGRFLNVTVSSKSTKYLLICNIVINRKPGPTTALDLLGNNATVVANTMHSHRSLENAIDGNSSSTESACVSLTGEGIVWLRVDIQSIHYIREVRLLYYEDGEANITISFGRSLRNNGFSANPQCKGKTVQNGAIGSQWRSVSCRQPILGQYIYTQSKKGPFRLCEIQVFYDYFLNIYSPVNVTASDQTPEYGSIWNPVDGLNGTTLEESWNSIVNSKSWWRMELPESSVVFSVMIYIPDLNNNRRRRMDDFIVYIGNSSVVDGSRNTICGSAGTLSNKSRQMTVDCTNPSVGKYLFVAAANRKKSALYLSEIYVYNKCEEPKVNITSYVTDKMLQSSVLACQGTTPIASCKITEAVWKDQEGNAVDNTELKSIFGRPFRTLVVSSNSYDGPYTCSISYARGPPTNDFTVSSVTWSAKLEVSPPNVTISSFTEMVSFNCTATGSPKLTVHWVTVDGAYNGDTSRGQSVNDSSTRILKVKGPSEGEKYKCVGTSSIGDKFIRGVAVYVAPQVHFSTKPIPAIIGQTLNITCTATQGYPPPKARLVIFNGTVITMVETNPSEVLHTMTVPSNWHAYTFNCSAKNTVGSAEKTHRFDGSFVKWPAQLEVSPPNTTISKSNDTFQFTCTATGYPQYSVHWIKVNDDVGNGNSIQSNLKTDLSAAYAGEGGNFRCIVKHSTGDPLIRHVSVYVTPQDNTTVPAIIGGNLTIHCTVAPDLLGVDFRCTAENKNSSEGSPAKWPVNLDVDVASPIETLSIINDTLLLDCMAIGYTEYSEYRHPVLADYDEFSNGYSTQISNDSRTTILTVKGPGDGGTYECIGTSTGYSRLFRKVTVYVPPQVAISVTPNTAIISKNLTINCTIIHGYPPPYVDLIVSNCASCTALGGRRSISHTMVVPSNWPGANFTCKASNTAGKLSKIKRIDGGSVKWPAKLEVSRPNATISEANDTVHFNCTVTGYPQYSLHWVKVCDTVGNDNSTQTSMKTPKNGLTVEGTGKGGKYRCIGKSSTAGPLVRDVTVYVTPQVNTSFAEIIGRNLTITCTVVPGHFRPNDNHISNCTDRMTMEANSSLNRKTTFPSDWLCVDFTCTAESKVEENSSDGSLGKWPVKLDVNPPIEPLSNVNDTINLDCTAVRYTTYSKYMTKAANSCEAVNGNSTQTSNDSTTSILTVKGPSKGGKYRCIGTRLGDPRLVQDVDVYVTPQVNISLTSVPAIISKNLTINCTVIQGFPQPDINLIISNCPNCEVLKGSRSVSHTMIVPSNLSGVNVTCTANNTVSTVSKRISFDDGSVKWPARLEISTSPPNATISKFNDTVHLICRATGYPQYNVHWVYDRTGSGKSTQSFREIPTNDLTVEGAGKGEKYRCIGKSSIGDLSIRDVDVYVTPQVNTSRPASIGRNLTINCTVVSGHSRTNVSPIISRCSDCITPKANNSVNDNTTVPRDWLSVDFTCTAEKKVGKNSSDGSSVKVPVKLHVNPLIEISSNINDTVSFECTAIRNIKDSEYRENAADAYEVTNGTSTKTGNESTTSTLTVKGPAEGGKYTCIGTSFEHPRLVQNVDVYVTPQVNISVIPIPPIISKNLTINCTVVQGYPQPDVNLVISNCANCTALGDSRSVSHAMIIPSRWPGAIFTCIANNTVSRASKTNSFNGTSAEWPAMLEVTPPNTTISYNNNETVHINCTATGYPKLNVRWVKVEGSEDRVTDFNSTESMKSPSTSTLTMSSSTSILTLKDKGGKYRCVGVSSTGNELVHDVIVYGLVAPRVTLSTTPSPARLGKKVTINCTVLQGFPQPLLSLAIPKCKECVSPKKGLFLVHKMSFGRNDLGKQYKCLAVNRAGTDEKTHVASVMPVARLSVSNSTVQTGDSITVSCRGLGYPPPQVSLFMPNGSVYNFTSLKEFKTKIRIGEFADGGGVYSCSSTNIFDTDITAVTVNVSLRFECKPESPSGIRGESVSITCTAFGYPLPPQIKITFPNGSNTSYPMELGKLTAKHALNVSVGHSAEGGGRYTFQVRDSSVQGESTVHVRLQVEGSITEEREGKMRYGENVTIFVTCVVSGYPLPTENMELLRNEVVLPTQSTYNLSSEEPTYKKSSFKIRILFSSTVLAGKYRCRQNTSRSSFYSNVITLKAGPYFTQISRNLTVTEGDKATLSCVAEGVPMPTVRWIRMSDSSLVAHVTNSTTEEFRVKVTALWNNTNRIHTGWYRCKAVDGTGATVFSASTYLDVQYAPEITVHPAFTRLTSSKETSRNVTLQLNCNVTGNPLPMVVWSKMPRGLDHWENVSDKWVFVVKRAVTNDSGTYRCMAWNDLGHKFSNLAQVFVQERPHSVQIVQISNVTARNFVVEWKKPFDGYSNITHYSIHLLENCNGKNEVHNTENVTEPHPILVNDLTPFSDYCISIQAFNALGGSNRASLVKVKTKAAAPGPVANMSVNALSSTTINVTWSKPNQPNGNIFQYSIDYSAVESDNARKRREEQNFIEVAGNTTETIIKGLEIFTSYLVTVTAVNEEAGKKLIGKSSREVVRTLEDESSAPVLVSVEPVRDKPKELNVTWKKPEFPNGNITKYAVNYRKFGHGLDETVEFCATGKAFETVILTKLEEYTNYSVQVRAISSLEGNLSHAVFGRTDEGKPSRPENFTVLSTTNNSVALRWDSPIFPRGIITKYEIQYVGKRHYSENREPQTDTQNKTKTLNIDQQFPSLQTNLMDLLPSTNFNFTIFALTSKGPGNSTSTVAITDVARPKRPVLPDYPVQVNKNGTRLQIKLSQPSNQFGNILYVDLLVAKMKANNSEIFDNETPDNYNASSPENTLYITARFNYSEVPEIFTIGDGKTYGDYYNGPLERGFMYFYALRSYSQTKDKKILSGTSEFLLADLRILSESSSSSSNTATAAAVVVVVVIIALVLILLFIICRRRRQGKEKQGRARYEMRPDETVMSSIEAAEIEKSATLGQTALLEVPETGLSNTFVEWRFNGKELPGEDERVKLLEDGSLQISNVKVTDYGVYECCDSRTSESSKMRLLVQMPSHGPKPIKLSEIEQYVEEMHANTNWGFSSQYSMLAKGERHPYTAARMEYNRSKNRYGNIVPYDHSRVVLEGEPGSDYINASYMDGYDGPNIYIAAQGPTDNTIDDFWRMVWEKNVVSIVMLTNLEEKGKQKCSKYWPADLDQYGDVTAKLCRVLSVSEFSVRSFLVKKNESDEERSVKHFHFIGWPDHGVPSYPTSLLNLIKLVRDHQDASEIIGPILVHCSAGVGRTGTYITIDNSLRQIQQDNYLDIYSFINAMRENRPSMVQTEDQYIFCHDAVLEYILCGDTGVPAHSLLARMKMMSNVDQETNVNGFEKEMKLLYKVSPDESTFTTIEATAPTNLTKNRYRDNLPPDLCCVHLSPIADKPAHFTYINACLLDAYRRREHYITTQGPLDHTVPEFWRMVWERQCGTIVMLTALEENGKEMSASYWPTRGTLEVGSLTIKMDQQTPLEEYTMRTFSLTSKEQGTRTVLQFHITKWPEQRCPDNAATLLEIMGKVERAQQKSGDNPVIVMCNNGIDRSGTFCAIGIAIDRLKSEQIVDVFQAVKCLRTQNPKFVRKQDHYKFCYTACMEYLDSFDTYANFKEL